MKCKVVCTGCNDSYFKVHCNPELSKSLYMLLGGDLLLIRNDDKQTLVINSWKEDLPIGTIEISPILCELLDIIEGDEVDIEKATHEIFPFATIGVKPVFSSYSSTLSFQDLHRILVDFKQKAGLLPIHKGINFVCNWKSSKLINIFIKIVLL